MSALRSFYQRWERLEADRKAILEDLKELFAEAKGDGWNPKSMRKAFREQSAYEADADAMDADRAEVELYLAEIRGGMENANAQAHDARLTPIASPSSPVSDGKGQGKHATAEVLGEGRSNPVHRSEAVETAEAGANVRHEVSGAPAPSAPPASRVHDHAPLPAFDPDPEMPAFLRRTG